MDLEPENVTQHLFPVPTTQDLHFGTPPPLDIRHWDKTVPMTVLVDEHSSGKTHLGFQLQVAISRAVLVCG